MNLLAIETSTDCASVAVVVEGEVFSEAQDGLRQHAQLILPLVERLCTTSGIRLNQLDGIVFGQGPGSFTGLRVACSVAKGLAYAHDLSVYPVSGLSAIANAVYDQEPELAQDTHVLAILDARMQQVYWSEKTPECQGEEQVSDPAQVVLSSQQPIVLAGVGFEAYEAQLPDTVRSQIVATRIVLPQARALIRLVLAGLIQPVHAAEALPVYIRNQVTQGGHRG